MAPGWSLRALPHAASTVAIGPDGDGSFLSPGSASTIVRADSERLRPLTHQLSVISIPAIIASRGRRCARHLPELRRMKVNSDAVKRERPGHARGNGLQRGIRHRIVRGR